MFSLQRTVCSIGLVIVLSCFAYAQAEIPPSAIEGWRSMANAVETLQFKMQYTDKNESKNNEYYCATQGPLEKCEFGEHGKLASRVAIYNKRGFLLNKRDNGKWQLTNIRDPGDRIGQLQNVIVLAKRGFSLHGSATLLDVVLNPKFEVLSWRELTDGSRNIELKTRENTEHGWITSTLILQPDKRFRVLSASYDDGDSAPSVYISEYADESLLTEIVPTKHYLRGDEIEWNLISIDNKTLPESDFALSYYGLPDYIEPARGVNWWLWLLIASAILTLGVFWKTRNRS